jgi:hypothetical protein
MPVTSNRQAMPLYNALWQRKKIPLLLSILLLSAFAAFSFKKIPFFTAHANSKTKQAARSATASDAATVRVKSGKPWISLADGRDLPSAYEGSAKAKESLQNNAAQPLSLASADFDSDGVADLVTGYTSPGGNAIVLRRGNVDALYPNAPEAQKRKVSKDFTDATFRF